MKNSPYRIVFFRQVIYTLVIVILFASYLYRVAGFFLNNPTTIGGLIVLGSVFVGSVVIMYKIYEIRWSIKKHRQHIQSKKPKK
jgi:hypothetical protein